MHDVIMIRRQVDGSLVCRTRIHERIAGGLLVLVMLPLVFALLEISTLADYRPLLMSVLACGLLLPGFYVALSSRRCTFEQGSRTCVVEITKLGIPCRQRQIEFHGVAIRRQFHWQFLRWLYSLALVDPSRPWRRVFMMGYAPGRGKAQAIARTIAEFTGTVAVDVDGRSLVSEDDS